MSGIHRAIGVVLFGLAACGGGDSTAPPTQTPGGGGSGGGGGGGGTSPVVTNSITVGDDIFTPASAQTSIGSTVTWTWQAQNEHNVTFASGSSSATQRTGTFARQFPAAGTFDYSCTIHAGMNGSILVK
jgi:plastocyanin